MITPNDLKADQEETLARLAGDAAFFIESCLFIIDKASKKVPFLLKPVQKLYLAARTGRDIILKARKMGFSTLIIALFLHACLFRENTYAVIVSHDKDATKRLFARLKYMIDNSLFPINAKVTGSEILFPDTGSKFWIGTAGSRKFGRGDDITHAHLSELFFYESLDIVTAVQEALVDDAVLIVESTANGAGTPSHDFWLRSERGETKFKTHFFAWFRDAGYEIKSPPLELDEYERKLKESFGLTWGQIAWLRAKIQEMVDPKLVAQEYPSTAEEAFLTSGRMVFDWQAIQQIEQAKGAIKWRGVLRDLGTESKIEMKPDGPLMIWRTPDKRLDYLITFDAAEGIAGLDWSVADVWEARSWEQVAQWRGYVDTAAFGDIVHMLGSMYGWAVVAGEVMYPGNAVMQRLIEKMYPNLWVDSSGHVQPNEGTPGWKTTTKSRPMLIRDGREALRQLDIKINSVYTLSELKTFVVGDDGKMAAQRGCHDDTVISMCGAAYILKRWSLDPEQRKRSFRDVLNRRHRRPAPAYPRRPGTNIV